VAGHAHRAERHEPGAERAAGKKGVAPTWRTSTAAASALDQQGGRGARFAA
jgi:hypothetical protein